MSRFSTKQLAAAAVCSTLAAGVLLTVTTLGASTAGTAAAAQYDPGGDSVSVGPEATVVDRNTGFTYTFGLRADEGSGGGGDVALGLQGPALSLCTVRGSGAFVDFTNVGDEAGETPVFQCGRAFGQTVSLDGCVATIVAHGYVHADHPYAPYLGTMTVDVRFQKTGAATGNLDVTVWAPKGKLEVHGKATGPIVMTTCP
jgi:hypothetical protein